MNTPIHIGEIIKNHLTEQKRSVEWLATLLGYDASALRKSLKKYYISTDLLFRISEFLEKDFFAFFSKKLSEKIK
ncbi:MAG: hypothetical protein FWH18_12010 [Marinilabiliaceae bacterium]|nr:hypothetical protein [Marinilabiliaceae bacterium]